MSDFSEKIKNHSFIVGTGTGVLINPHEGDFSYVLTAKHVIEHKATSEGFLKATDIRVFNWSGEPIAISARYVSPTDDLAILVTSNRLDAQMRASLSPPVRDEKLYFFGYPKTRRGGNPEDILREFPGEVQSAGDRQFILQLTGEPDWDQIAGASGGGVYRGSGEEAFLCGLEYRIEGDTASERHGRVLCHDFSLINELLEKENLPPIYPSSMNDFCSLVSHTFKSYDKAEDPENVRYLKATLHERAKQISKNGAVRPIDIYKARKEALLIKGSPLQDLYEDHLWIAYLEFLVISCLIDLHGNIEFSYVDSLFAKRRFLFSAHDGNWVHRLREIYHSDFRGLEVGGVVVVSTADTSAALQPKEQSTNKIVVDIGRVGTSQLMVDSVINNPALQFRLYHLTGMHRICVTDKEFDYGNYWAGHQDFEEQQLFEKLRGEYCAYM
ncbi:ABC-three component system protein [Pseudomonas sp. LT1P18]|uniref:ABC-three component system protein n=1 Tax=Pseudomonas arabinosi TaxID=3398357 RepID=UPI0039EE4727